MIRIDAIWLATEPIDMRIGFDTAFGKVVQVFGAVRPHHAYLFANKPSTRIKVLVYDGFGIWLASRRLNKGRFVWADSGPLSITLNADQLQALVTGLPWQTRTHDHHITVL
ncbi:IS66 family insertion sequence element accessory protein TnpB [Undibacterium sp. Di26W]|uniref:IS66 family insertion sequence element accessory protein TnpB n=1 Tax=Undibacterium sp. Di26W TaxID=3413035 RepID=UPI003BF3043D